MLMNSENTRWRWFAGSIPLGELTYEIVIRYGSPCIKCRLCGMVSASIHDVEQQYCGHCRVFHDQIEAMRQSILTNFEPGRAFSINLNDGCPDCFAKEFRWGPAGGMCRNLECVTCRSRFNVMWGVFCADRIEDNGMPFYDPETP